MRRHIDMHEFAPTMSEEDEDVQRLKGQGLDGKEVGSPDLRPVMGQERAPALARRARLAAPAIATNRAIAGSYPEFQEFAADAFGAPEGIVA